MKRRIIFVQGGGQDAHDEWDSMLVESLRQALGPRYDMLYPNMPNEADPSYERWAAALRVEFAKQGDGAILVGHSIGATILINALADEARTFRPGGVFLVAAPFVGDGGWPPSDEIGDMSNLGQRALAQYFNSSLPWRQGRHGPCLASRTLCQSNPSSGRASAF